MTTTFRIPFAVLALAMSVGAANAQSAQSPQEHEAHHPPGQSQPQAAAAPATGQRPMGAGPGSPGMMMGGDMGQMNMGQMMGMMQQMMRGGMMMPMGAEPMGMGGRQPFRHIEGQLAFYKAELRITEAQLPQWNALADVIRANAKRLRESMTPAQAGTQAGAATAMPTAPEQLERRAAQLSLALEAMKAAQGPAKTLYAAFSPEQKKIADELLAEHMMTMRMRGL